MDEPKVTLYASNERHVIIIDGTIKINVGTTNAGNNNLRRSRNEEVVCRKGEQM